MADCRGYRLRGDQRSRRGHIEAGPGSSCAGRESCATTAHRCSGRTGHRSWSGRARQHGSCGLQAGARDYVPDIRWQSESAECGGQRAGVTHRGRRSEGLETVVLECSERAHRSVLAAGSRACLGGSSAAQRNCVSADHIRANRPPGRRRRRTSVRQRRYVVAFVIVGIAFGTVLSAQVAPTPPPGSDTPLQVQVVVSRYQGEKKISSLPYSLSVNPDGRKTSLRMGAEVPIVMTTTPAAARGEKAERPRPRRIQLSVDSRSSTNIDCSAIAATAGKSIQAHVRDRRLVGVSRRSASCAQGRPDVSIVQVEQHAAAQGRTVSPIDLGSRQGQR